MIVVILCICLTGLMMGADNMMTIDEAIEHCYDIVNNECKNYECRLDHKQLAEWLTELKKYREAL